MSNEESRLELKPGPGGWVEARWAPDASALIRFDFGDEDPANPDDARLAELRLVDPTTERLRAVPLGRIEMSAKATTEVVVGLAVLRNEPVPEDLERWFAARPPARMPTTREKLTKPRRGGLDDAFYRRVANAYRVAVANGVNPRPTIARDAGASPDTVARWVSEARRRGFLPKTTPGKVAVDATEEDIDG